MSFHARFPDRCDDCGGHIKAGTLVEIVASGGVRHIRHQVCPDDPAVSLRPGETVCPACFLVQPCPCGDAA